MMSTYEVWFDRLTPGAKAEIDDTPIGMAKRIWEASRAQVIAAATLRAAVERLAGREVVADALEAAVSESSINAVPADYQA
jgi:hypothetical protein